MLLCASLRNQKIHSLILPLDPLRSVGTLMTLIVFTLSNARRIFSSKGIPLAGKGLSKVVSRQGKIIGTTHDIDYKYIKENPISDPGELKGIFITEAERYYATSLNGKVTLPIGVDYIPCKLDGEYTYNTTKENGKASEKWHYHLKSSLNPSKNGTLKN